MWIQRNIASIILKVSKQYPVVLLTGARQVGKTTLLTRLFNEYDYVSFDLPSIAEQAETNPQLFFSKYNKNIILDEVQYVPEIFRYLKHEVDKDPQKGRFILAGSQNFALMKNITESLAGRCAVLQLYPLSYSEIHAVKQYDNTTDIDFILKGGYPKLWSEPQTVKEIFFSSYIATYIERDVRNIINIGKIRDFERFFRALAIRSSQIVSYSDLARDVGVAVSTIKEWMSVLWASNQIFFLEPYYRNLGKRLIKSPKVYITDVGLLCFLLNIKDHDDLMHSPLLGQIWETYVVCQLMIQYSFKGLKAGMYYWRTRDGSEVDVIMEHGGKIIALEIKFSEFVKGNEVTSLKNLIATVKKEHVHCAGVIARTSHRYTIDDIINVMPLDEALELL
jgi:predicted AAA+ superfamily ATPase